MTTGVRPDPPAALEELVGRLYAALAAGDAPALQELLHDEFHSHFAEGLPFGIGGEHRGPEAAIGEGWWAIGRAYRLQAVPEEWIHTTDGRLVVRGFYRGSARSTGTAVEAEFVHLWAVRDNRIVSLRQLTDTVQWTQALTPSVF